MYSKDPGGGPSYGDVTADLADYDMGRMSSSAGGLIAIDGFPLFEFFVY